MLFDTLIQNIIDQVVNPLIAILFTVALVVFLWGVTRFIFKADDENERAQGKQNMIWGLFGMFIMVSVFAIISLLANTIGFQDPTGGGRPF